MSTMNQLGKYQPYPEYKDSGVEWLGEVPTHWFLHALKRSVSGCVNGIWGDEPNGDSDLIVLRVADFDRNKLIISDDKLTYRSISEKERKNRLLKKGDLLIEKSGGGEKTLVGCVVLFDKEYAAVTSNFVAKMTPNPSFHGGFLNYAFNHLYSGRVNYPSIKQTTGIQNLDSESYLMEHFCFPVFSEQRTIAAFLDYETARIDQLIAKQQQLIELLKEKRQAVISHAVTKGLNPNAPMKDSGVEWLGQVPEHWVICKIKNLASVISKGTTPSTIGAEFIDEGVRFLKAENIGKSPSVNSDPEFFISEGTNKQISRSQLKENDVLVIIAGATTGAASILQKEMLPANTNQAVSFIRPVKRVFSKWMLSWLATDFSQRVIWMGAVQAAQPNLSMESLGNIPITLPPESEIQDIISTIDFKLNKFEQLTNKAEETISLMQERRTALISAAVTGKIDLRGWQPPKREVAA